MNINQSKSRSVRQKQSQSVPSHGGPLLSRYVTTPPLPHYSAAGIDDDEKTALHTGKALLIRFLKTFWFSSHCQVCPSIFIWQSKDQQ